MELPGGTAVRRGEWQHLQSAARVKCIAFSPQADFLLAGLEGGLLELWDGTAMPLKARTYMLPGSAGADVESVAWSFNNRLLFVGLSDMQFMVVDVEDGSIVQRCM